MEHVSRPIARVVRRTALLCQDTRAKTLFPPKHRIREPERGYYFGFKEHARGDINIDHDALLDAAWKLRVSIAMFENRARRTECSRTKALLSSAAAGMKDELSDIETALARKAEAELWLENIE